MTEVTDWYTEGGMVGVSLSQCWTQNQWQHGLTVVKKGSLPDSLALWFERRTVARDQKVVAGSNPCWSGGTNFLLQGQPFVLTLISVFVPPPCYRSST